MTDKTAIQRIQELDRERTTLFEQAKEEALRRATQAVEDLNALGLKYRLVEGESAAGSKGASNRPQEKGQAEKRVPPLKFRAMRVPKVGSSEELLDRIQHSFLHPIPLIRPLTGLSFVVRPLHNAVDSAHHH